jgi:hypothetical protein
MSNWKRIFYVLLVAMFVTFAIAVTVASSDISIAVRPLLLLLVCLAMAFQSRL